MTERSALSRDEKLALLARLARQKERAARAFPLSFAQQRLWFLDQLDPGSHANNIFRAVTWSGPLDSGSLRRALSEVVRRHEALRACFPEVDGEPRQKVAPAAELPLPVEDLSSLPPEEGRRRARELAEEESRFGFDLARGPLFHSRLVRLAEGEHVLFLAMHHMVSDGWSMGLLFHEITVLYRAFAAGLPSPLPEPALQFPDFAAWQRERLTDERLAGELTWWRQRLAGFPDYLELPGDHPRPAAGSFRGALATFTVPAELSEGLRALARGAGATPFMVLLAAFETFLYRISGQDAFLVATNVAGRNRTELEGVIGFFTEILLLRARVDRDLTFRELLAWVRRDSLEAQAHQELPFERLVEELQPERHLSHNPLYQVLFVLQNLPGGGAVEIPGVQLGTLPLERGLAKLDLTLEMLEHDGVFSGYFEYNTDLFERATVERLAGHFLQLLGGIAGGGADRPIGELPLLTPEQREQALAGWNPRFSGAPGLVPERISEQARRAPEAPAVLFEDGVLTYAELEAGANRLAWALRRLGAGPDARVGVCLERSLAMPMALLGVLKAGAAWVPLDPSYPRERLAVVIEDTAMPVLLTTRDLAAKIPGGDARVVCLDDPGFAVGEDESAPGWEIHPEGLAYVVYTSGSTGRPKGVGVPHRSLANHAASCAERYALGPEDRALQFTSISFDITSEEIFPTWLAGGAVVPRPPGLFPSIPELHALIERHGVTVANLPTAYWHEWVSELVRSGERPPAPLRLVIVGTEQALPERVAEWLEVAPGVRWINGYASTEATVTALTWEPGANDAKSLHTAPRVPVGKPIRNCRVYVLDAAMEPVPVGVSGDVYIGGPNVSRGYLGWPDRTAASFVPDPFADELGYGPGQRLYRQGDRGRYLADGTVECLGRSDFQVKVRGFRVEPGEIEAMLARHPAVEGCVVLANDDGSGNRRLTGYAAPVAGRSLQAEELRAFLKDSLPDFMVPAGFVVLPSLPLNVNGKIDRRALARLTSAASMDAATAGAASTTAAPRSPIEELVAAIWAELLHLDRVGPHDSFFDLGGHSLLAIQVISRMREALGVEVPLRALFEEPTVAGLAAAAEAARREEAGLVAPPITPAPRDLPPVCSFSQQRLWFLDQLLPGDPAYNIPVAVRFQGVLDLGALALALSELARRHESLRTTFAAAPGGQPVQIIAAAAPSGASGASAPPPVVDLRGLPGETREAEAFGRLIAESVLPFDLVRGPLWRPCFFRLDEDDLLLYFAIHHIVCDGVSISILLQELVVLYGAFARGAGSILPTLPPLALQYADFAAWQRTWLQGEALARQVSYWRAQLAGAPVVIELPTDRPRPAVQTSHGARHYFRLPASLVKDLAALGRRERCTLFMTLQGVLNALLGRYSGQEDVLVGWPIAGRNRAELEGVVGFLANILVLRTDLRGEPGYRRLLARVREAALGAYAHQDLPFEQLVEELRPERHLSHNPIFQIFFVLHYAASGAPGLPGIEIGVPSIDNRTTRGDLLVSLSETGDSLAGLMEYNTDLFDASTVERMTGHFLNLLHAVLADQETALAALPILGAEERRQIVETWNETAAPFPDRCIHQLFEAQAERSPGSIALVFDGDGESLTYGELNARANRLAHRLRAEGAGPGELVGLCLERSAEMVVALLAVLKSGGAYVPLDPAYPPDRLAFVLEDSGARVLLTQPELRYSLPAGGLTVIEVEAGEGDGADAGNLEPLAGPQDLAYVIYTSGSTGRPKGVAVRHAGVVSFLASMAHRPGLTADDALLAVTTISFDIAALELYLPLAVGGRIVLASRDTVADGGLLAALLAASGASVMQATPATWRLLLAAGWRGGPGLKVLCGGEALPLDLAAELLPRVGSLWNVYGPTETTIWSTVEPVLTAAGAGGSVPIGCPLANTGIYLLDRHLEPVPVGVAGELYIGGVGVARGYLGRPELTAERFVPDPFGAASGAAPGARLYRTGDLARHLPDGRVAYLGRTDFQVKVRGFRIELGEIEAALSRHPAVAQAVVAVHEPAPGNPQLVAFYVPAEGRAVSVGNLRAALREELPDYMIPALFVTLPALPLTPNGKVDRKALPAPEGVRPDLGREYVAPEGEVQEKLAAIWAEVLRVGRVGARDNFFELGGHSLMATQVLSRVQGTFGAELALRVLFDNPTVAGLAEAIVQKSLAHADADLLAKLLAEIERD